MLVHDLAPSQARLLWAWQQAQVFLLVPPLVPPPLLVHLERRRPAHLLPRPRRPLLQPQMRQVPGRFASEGASGSGGTGSQASGRRGGRLRRGTSAQRGRPGSKWGRRRSGHPRNPPGAPPRWVGAATLQPGSGTESGRRQQRGGARGMRPERPHPWSGPPATRAQARAVLRWPGSRSTPAATRARAVVGAQPAGPTPSPLPHRHAVSYARSQRGFLTAQTRGGPDRGCSNCLRSLRTPARHLTWPGRRGRAGSPPPAGGAPSRTLHLQQLSAGGEVGS
mmetsp:Transcript_29325/g.85488  ORF Transcript_29325/g.85488 Transcript_29325/m.85488 type:complete len:279 (-) Transcript_29325:459-1295(-)